MDWPARFDRLLPTIEELMRVGGTAGLSLGVMFHGDTVYQANFGFRDQANRLPMTEDTIMPVASLTKAITAAAMGILVDERKAAWSTLVKDALPTFNSKDDVLQRSATIADLLSHRTGLSKSDNLWMGTNGDVLISEADSMTYINAQTRMLPFRGQFSYNNVAYDLAGKVIESLSKTSYFDFVQNRILGPLGMDRTYLKTPSSDIENISKCHNTLDDGSVAEIPCLQTGDHFFAGASCGMRTCVRDLFKLYKPLMTSFNEQRETGETSSRGSPLKQVAQLLSAKVPFNAPSRYETSYAFGWCRVQTPGRMGQIGINPRLMPGAMPVLGTGASPRLLFFHQGCLPGALSFVVLVPDTTSAIVVLTNTLALTDVADWVGQVVLEELLDVPEHLRNDYLSAANSTVKKNLEWYPALTRQLDEAREQGTSPSKLESYVGTFWDPVHVFKIFVSLEDGVLFWALQGLDSEKFRLRHYERDTFLWLQPRNDLSRRGRFVGWEQGPFYWKVHFQLDSTGKACSLSWAHDDGVPAVEYRRTVEEGADGVWSNL